MIEEKLELARVKEQSHRHQDFDYNMISLGPLRLSQYYIDLDPLSDELNTSD